jgi:hypothetical protein
MTANELANAVTIAKTISTFSDDELMILNQHLTGVEEFSGQLARFVNAKKELKVVVGLFTKLSVIPALAAG